MIRVSKSKKTLITQINEKMDDIFMLETVITIQWTSKQ